MSHVEMKSHWSHHYHVECHDKNGKLMWVDDIDNLVTTVGENDYLNQYYAGSGYTAANFVGVTNANPVFDISDTMASHAGWTELTAYTQATRPAPTWGTASFSSIVATAVTFTFNASGTVGGAFLATDSTIGGTTGVLIGGAAFTTNWPVTDGSTLNVTLAATL